MSAPVPLVIAYGNLVHDQTKALIDGEVTIEGCSLSFVQLVAGEMLFRSFNDPQFNIAELSLSNYIARRARGDCPYTALPVFISRSFRHADYYIRTDRGIVTPQDLRGRRIGINEYHHTAYVWARGILESDYGVRPRDVQWISVGGGHGHDDGPPFVPPAGVSIDVRGPGRKLSDMLADGDVDALIAPQVPACFAQRAPNVGRLFADHRTVEDDFYRRREIFPVLHLMGMRNELVAQHAGLAGRVYRAFLAAKDRALAAKRAAARLPGAAPGLVADVARMSALMGDDCYSYGFNAGNRKMLDTFLDFHFAQGISSRRHTIEEIFAPLDLHAFQS
jgi:4,5-dihydroxyphthalate decarboxylase